MVVRLHDADGVKVYNLTAGKALPSWVQKKGSRSLNKDPEYSRHVELIQNFGFPSACHRVKITRDKQHVFATGVHAPRVRVFDLDNLSLKYEHHFDAEIVDFQVLTEDYSKSVYLCMDRTVQFHTRMGRHFTTRVPRAGRAVAYDPRAAHVLLAGSAPEVWRLSCSEGRFMTPLPTSATAINALGVCPTHGMLAAAGHAGVIQCFDPRQHAPLGTLDAAAAASCSGEDLTALRFDRSGMYAAVGTCGGRVALFDLRRPVPLVVKDHMYDSPITGIKFHTAHGDHNSTQRVVSSDRHIIKVWDMTTGKGFTNIEPEGAGVNGIALWPGCGLVLAGTDATQIGIYFVPALGPAPRWASFLEGIVEDLEATGSGPAAVYDDYRFVTKAELAKLQLEHLLGTPVVRAYMHGFFIDNRLYHKARNRIAPFAYEAYRQKRIEERIEAERRSRIAMVKKLPAVNAQTHIRLQASAMADASGLGTKRGRDGEARGGESAAAGALLKDERFGAMFEDADFEIDETSQTYKELHPNAANRKKSVEEQLVEEHFREELIGPPSRRAGVDAGSGVSDVATARATSPAAPAKAARMLVARDEASADLFVSGTSLAALRDVPLAERAAASAAAQGATTRVGGNRDLSFKARDLHKGRAHAGVGSGGGSAGGGGVRRGGRRGGRTGGRGRSRGGRGGGRGRK